MIPSTLSPAQYWLILYFDSVLVFEKEKVPLLLFLKKNSHTYSVFRIYFMINLSSCVKIIFLEGIDHLEAFNLPQEEDSFSICLSRGK